MEAETNEPNRFEHWLWRVAVISFGFLIAIQGLELLPQVRYKLAALPAAVRLNPTGSSDGPVSQVANNSVSSASSVTIRLIGNSTLQSPAKVCINGKQIGSFSGDSFTMAVSANDVVTINTSDSPGIYEFAIDYNKANTAAIISPISGETFDSSLYHAATIGPFLVGKQ